eukprot:m.467227 g.467227  ORF g.467227 m.467227 type:complete len:989 (+) comp21635_c0_seq1:226-3192(+)
MASPQNPLTGGKRRKRKALPALPSARPFGLASASPSPADDTRASNSPRTPSLPITPVSEVSPTLLGAAENDDDPPVVVRQTECVPMSEVTPTLLGLPTNSDENNFEQNAKIDDPPLNETIVSTASPGDHKNGSDTPSADDAVHELQTSLATPAGWKMSVAGEEDTRKNILSWLSKRRVEQALKRSAALSSGQAVSVGNTSNADSGTSNSESRSAMTTAQFQRRLIQVSSETQNPSYLHVKQILVAEFGNAVFQDNRDDVRMHLKALAHLQGKPPAGARNSDGAPSQQEHTANTSENVSPDADSSGTHEASSIGRSNHAEASESTSGSTQSVTVQPAKTGVSTTSDFDDLDELLTFARVWCNNVLEAGESVTYLRLKISMSEHFGRMAIEMNKTRIQNFIQKYSAAWNNETDGNACKDHMQSLEDQTTCMQADAERLARRMQLRSDMQAKLQSMQKDASDSGEDHGDEEERLMFDQLAELDVDIVRLTERVNPNGPHAGKYFFLFLPDHVVKNILGMLPTKCLLCVIPRVCTRFRNLVRKGNDCHLTFSWARRLLSDRILAKHALPAVSSIQSLSLVSCMRLTDEGCHIIAKTQSATLQYLDLSHCNRVTDTGLRALTVCRALVDMRLRECTGITTSGVRALTSKLRLLQYFDLTQMERKIYDVVTADTIDALGSNCPQLRALHLGRCGAGVSAALATGTLAAAVGENLRVLDIRGCSVFDDAILQVARHVKQLRRLYASGNPQLSMGAIRVLVDACPELRVLDLGGVAGVDDDSLAACLHGKTQPLEELSLSRCTALTDSGLGAVAARLAHLRYLNVSFSDQITNAGLRAVASACPRLLALDASCCFLVTSAGIQAVAEHCHVLLRLVVRGCTAIQDDALQSIAAHCAALQSLDVSNCVKLGDTGLGAIVAGCAQLSDLRMGACCNATDALAAALIAMCQRPHSKLHRVDCGGSGISEPKQREIEEAIAQNSLRIEACDTATGMPYTY